MSQLCKRSSADNIEPVTRTPEDSTQDWVCVKCNNLNFSFRKKCNRCKVQSREDNQQSIYADYYYYNHYYSVQGSAIEGGLNENRKTEKAIEEK